MSGHTPGPWKRVAQDDSVWADRFGRQVAHCMSRPGVGMLHARGEREANARLIAAAPELLDALRWAMTRGNLTYVIRTKANVAYCDAVDAALAAIAKAGGAA